MRVLLLAAAAAIALSAAATSASAASCVERLPRDRDGYWAYRLVKGKKCWYQARGAGRHHRRSRRKDPPAPAPPVAPQVRVVEPDEVNEVDARAPPNYDYMFSESLDAYEPDFRRRGRSLGESHEFHLRFRGEDER